MWTIHLFVQTQVHSAETALQRLGLETGVVVDIGLGTTRACPVVDGKVVREGIQAQFIGAANVKTRLLQALHARPDVQQAFAERNMSGFEVMLCVKAMKEEQLAVASSTAEALRDCPCTTPMLPLSTATGQHLFCSNELLKAAEMFFAPTRIRGSDAGYYGSDVPAPTKGLHELVRDAADYLPKVERCDVVLIGMHSSFEAPGRILVRFETSQHVPVLTCLYYTCVLQVVQLRPQACASGCKLSWTQQHRFTETL